FQAEAIKPLPGIKPYPALELAGRDVYIREGCYNCHSQMVRTLRFETERYGHYSLAGESVYDRPFQWGSRRTGPDLARVGGRYSDDWHRVHLIDPRAVVPESNMPGFPWLQDNRLDGRQIAAHMTALQRLGDPYTDEEIAQAPAEVAGKTELDAVVAYLPGLGKHAPRGNRPGLRNLHPDPEAAARGPMSLGMAAAQAPRLRRGRAAGTGRRGATGMSTGWTAFIVVLAAFNVLGAAWLLWWTAKRRPGDPKPEETSHYWDGDITEFNKPMPRWWINWFYLMIVFGIGYLAWYGGLGGIEGLSNWSSQDEHALAKAADDARLEETFAPYKGRPIDQIAADPAAIKLGQSIFSNNCATCHGSSAQGAIGFPNLGDDIWHWGGSPDDILTSILDGREGVMPEWGTVLTGMGGDSAVISVVAYVRSLSDPARSKDYLAVQGQRLYEGVCVA